MPEYVKRLLKEIRQRPGAWLGKKSLERLVFTITGYAWCMWERGEAETPECLPGFQEFIAERYEIRSAHNWSDIIQFYCATEEEAFDDFYNLLYEFYGQWDK